MVKTLLNRIFNVNNHSGRYLFADFNKPFTASNGTERAKGNKNMFIKGSAYKEQGLTCNGDLLTPFYFEPPVEIGVTTSVLIMFI